MSIAQFFDSSAYIPHGLCLAWQPEVLALHVSSDMLIGLSYYSIPLALVYFVRRRRDVAFSWVFWLFASFILACGTTHFFSVWTLWNPDYGMEGLIKAATAAVSLLTAVALWWLMPRALALPSPEQLTRANQALQREIAIRRAAEERYMSFFENLAEGLFVVAVQPDGSLAYDMINDAYAKATGFRPEEMSGRPPAEVMDAEAAATVSARCRACIAAGRPIDFEEALDLPVGRRVWHTVLVPVKGEDGRVRQILGSARDITERTRLQAELTQAAKLATLGTLAAGMAHELSQPLNVVRMWAENALSRFKEGTLDATRTERVLTLMSEQAERMGRIIEHMRIFSRRSDPAEADEPFDPVPSVTAALDLMRHQCALDGIGIAAVTPFPAGQVLVRGRPLQLEQVLVNLLANARDAIRERRGRGESGAGRIEVALSLTEPGGALVIEVTDDGGGIPEDVLARIFDPFFTTKEVGKGTGLGLSIGYGIVEAMSGRIEAGNVGHPEGSRGARFTVTLPTVQALADREAFHA